MPNNNITLETSFAILTFKYPSPYCSVQCGGAGTDMCTWTLHCYVHSCF